MLTVTIPESEIFDPKDETFYTTKKVQLSLEHSLVSISKWEAKHCKPFLTDASKTEEEILDYIKCMTLNQNVDADTYKCIPANILLQIKQYIESPMTATTISGGKQTSKKQIMTSELLYYYMIAYQIPFECQKWHLNRLMTLIRICDAKNQDPKKNKMKVNDVMKQNASLNAARKKALGTKG